MRLVRLSVNGLKALQGVRLDVPQLLALTGPNGAGKSSVLQAIRLGVLGYEPSVGRQLAATRQLAAGDSEIEVGLGFDTGFMLRRRFGASAETEISPTRGERNERDRQGRITAESGAFVFSLDLASWLELSAEKRRDLLFGMLPRESVGLTPEVWRTWLGFDVGPDFLKQAIDKLWTEHVHASLSPLDGLASAIDFTHRKFLEAEQERRAQVTVTERAEAEAARAAQAGAPEDPQPLQDVLAEIERKLGDLHARAEGVQEAAAARRREEHNQEVLRQRIDGHRESLAKLAGELERGVWPTAEEVAAYTQELTRAETRARSQREAVTYTGEILAERRQAWRTNSDNLTALGQHEACPVCGSEDIAAARDRLLDSETALRLQEQQANQEHTAAREKQQAFDLAVTKARNSLDNARVLFDQRARLEAEIASTQKLLAELEREAAKPAALPPVPEAPSAATFVALEQRRTQIRTELRELEERNAIAQRAAGVRRQADEARRELEQRTVRAEALKRLHAALLKLRAHLIEQLVLPVQERASEILASIDPAKTFRFVFEREGKSDFDFGFEEQGVFRSYDAASTGEDAFLAVVLVAALVAAVRPPWRLLLVDNLEQLDDARRAALMDAIARPEIAGLFDNVIVAGCAPFAEVDGWQVVDVRELTAAAVQAA